MLRYCKTLKFDEDPNYDNLRQLLKDMFVRNSYDYDYHFDWNDHAAALEKKSTYMHLMDRQLQLARLQSGRKLPESDDKYFSPLLVPRREDAKDRSWRRLTQQTPKNEQNSLAVHNTSYGPPDLSPHKVDPLRPIKPELLSPYSFLSLF